MRALYVEDNETDVQLAREALSRAVPAIQMDTVSTVSDAIERLSTGSSQYHWVLFDLSLPDGDGFQVLHYVRENKLPLAALAVTGSGDERSVIRALKLGADDYVIKHGDYLDYLVDTLHKVLNRTRFDFQYRPLRVLLASREAHISPIPGSLAESTLDIEADIVSGFADVLPRLNQSGYDVLLIDIEDGPSSIDALELIRRIRYGEENPIPIIAIASHGSELIASQALRLGVNDYLVKDETYLHQLAATIESVSSKAQLLDVAIQRERLRVTHEAMEVANRQKSRFIADMSHEIRTPLNGLLGLLFLMQKTSETEELRNLLNMAEQSGQYLLQVLNDILDLSKLEIGGLKLERLDFRITDLLKRIRAILASQAESKGLQLMIDLAPDVPLELQGDSLRLQQILLNLASNAIKFTEKGSVAICVSSRPSSGDKVPLVFSVKDSGIGLTGKQQKSIFAPFHQADASISRRYGGTGLGLALAKELVTLMGGDIRVSSEIGVGSEFVFEVVLDRAQDAQFEHAVEVIDSDRNIDAVTMRGASVLLVDDNHINQLVTRAYLQHLQIDVDICDNGEDAVEAVRNHPADHYDLILLDLHMPGMDGFTAAETIRALPQGVEIPIIALTASVSRKDQERCRQVGMNDFLVKPIGLAGLSAKLALWLPVTAIPGELLASG